MSPTAGYSGKPLAIKLGIKPGMTVSAVDAPRGYRALLGALPEGARVQVSAGRAATNKSAALPLIHYFATQRTVLAPRFPALVRSLAPAGALWISWPKGGSKVATDLNENVVREIGLAAGLVDVKVCAVDETWSALKFVRRVKHRQP